MKKISVVNFIPCLLSLPSVLIGAVVMAMHQIPASFYIQNIIFLLLGSILSVIYISCEVKFSVQTIKVLFLCGILALCSAFFFPGLEGVHRWIRIGPLSINLAFIVLPFLLIGCHTLLENEKYWFSYLGILVIGLILFFQPDASMICAFWVAALLIAFHKGKRKLTLISMLVLAILTVLSWCNLDRLAPVPYVEDILLLARESGLIYFLFCLISLFLLLCPFWFKVPPSQRHITISLGLFFAMIIISTLFGCFPVPLIGYGVSPIMGYFIAASWVVKRKYSITEDSIA